MSDDMQLRRRVRAGTLAVTTILAAFVMLAAAPSTSAQQRAQPPKSPRLFVFDCGRLKIADTGRFQLKKEEVAVSDLSVACFMVAHPKGTLMWDTGAVPDSAWKPTGSPVDVKLVLPDKQEREVTMVKPLRAQLAEAVYQPSDITHFSTSHYHYDHNANDNLFAGATWFVRQVERDAMFAAKPTDLTEPANFSALQKSKTVIIKTDDYDVFGDGTVVIKFTPGHTPGHQVLYLKLAKTGPVLLVGDLYHYPEERTLSRVPTFEFNQQQTVSTRTTVETFLKKTSAQLWIQHDFAANAKLKKSPAYYD